MQHKCRVEVLERKCFSDYREKYLADPKSGKYPFYHEGDEFIFERYGKYDDFWTEWDGSQCAEAWDCINRYIYTSLQGGSILRNWTNDERIMIACCNDGTRPVIFKIERMDYYVLKFNNFRSNAEKVSESVLELDGVISSNIRPEDEWLEVFVDKSQIDNEGLFVDELKKLSEDISVID